MAATFELQFLTNLTRALAHTLVFESAKEYGGIKATNAATFEFEEDTGTAAGSPVKGTTRTAAVTDVNWKNSGVQTDAYSSFPVVQSTNSFDKHQFCHLSGTFNQILNGLFAHTATAFGSSLTLKGVPAMTVDGDNVAYRTPAITTNAGLTTTMTSAIAIGSGVAVWFGATGPEATGKAASMTTNPCYSNWLTTQLVVGATPASGDTASVTLTAQYDENTWIGILLPWFSVGLSLFGLLVA